jgi:hypothetical protein
MLPHMNDKDFKSGCSGKSSQLRDDMTTSRAITAGKRKDIPDEGVSELMERGVKVSRPYYFLNATEYKEVFHKSAPPPKKAQNTISMPAEDDSGEELLYIFKTSGLTDFERQRLSHYRQGHMYTKKVLLNKIQHLKPKFHRFARQSGKVIHHHLKKSGIASTAATVRTMQEEREAIFDPEVDKPELKSAPKADCEFNQANSDSAGLLS